MSMKNKEKDALYYFKQLYEIWESVSKHYCDPDDYEGDPIDYKEEREVFEKQAKILDDAITELEETKQELDECKKMIARYNEDMEPSIVDDIAFKKVPDSLENAFSDYCFECGNGEDYVLLYVKAHENESKALLDEAKQLKDGYKEELVFIVLSTDCNIYTPWFKAFLKHCAQNSKYATLKYRAEEILKYYKKGFDKVEDMD